MSWKRRGIALLGICSFASSAYAQADISTKAAAEGLFDQGRDAMRKGDFATACGLLERSQQLDAAVGTLLYLAECYEKAGRTASAWATFREAAAAARAVGQMDRSRIADERAERLTAQLSRLVIEVGEGPRAISGLVIRRQGQPIPAPAWNVAVPLDPGKYRIEASAPGYTDWTETVEVSPGGATATITVPTLAAGSSASDTAVSSGGPGLATMEPGSSVSLETPPYASPGSTDTRRIATYALAGVGVAGIGVGTFFGLRAISKNDDAEGRCPETRCNDRKGVSLAEEASDAATISNVAFGVGLAALAGGVVLYLTAPSTSGETTPIAASLGPTGVSLRGAF